MPFIFGKFNQMFISHELKEVEPPKKMKLFASSDWHGNKVGAVSALKQAGLIDDNEDWIGGDSILVILGDLIDRGGDSRGCIDLALKLGPHVKRLKGNHEQMLLDAMTNFGWYDCWLRNGGLQCLESYSGILMDEHFQYDYWDQDNAKKIYKHHKEYFDTLEEFCIIDDNLFVHAGVAPADNIESLTKGESIDYTGSKNHLWIRDRFYNHPTSDFVEDNYGVKRIIFGHTPTSRYILKDEVSKMVPLELMNKKLLAVDCGSYYPGQGGVCVVSLSETSYTIAGIAYNA